MEENGAPIKNGRNEHGRFVKGNAGGPGNPHLRDISRIRRLVLDCTTDEEFIAVWETLKVCAQNGKPWAVKEFLDRVLGKPKESIDITTRTDVEQATNRLREFLGAN